MRKSTKNAYRLMFALIPATVAWTGVNYVLSLTPESRLWVEGTSSVRSFKCEAKTFDAVVESTSPTATAAVLGGEKVVTKVDVTVPTNRLDCGNGTMNEHMLKALKAKEHAAVAFRLESYELTRSAEGTVVLMTGELTLGGVTKPITVNAQAQEGENGTLRVIGAHAVNMKEFGLKPPTLMMGTLKVGERVNVRFDLQLKA